MSIVSTNLATLFLGSYQFKTMVSVTLEGALKEVIFNIDMCDIALLSSNIYDELR